MSNVLNFDWFVFKSLGRLKTKHARVLVQNVVFLWNVIKDIKEILKNIHGAIHDPGVLKKIIKVIKDNEELYQNHVKRLVEKIIKNMKAKYAEIMNKTRIVCRKMIMYYMADHLPRS